MKRTTASALLAGLLMVGCSKPAGSNGPAGAQAPTTPVARVNGQVITEAELAAEAKDAVSAAEAKAAQEVHDIRGRALDALVERKLIEAKAKAEGITVEALLQREVTAKIPEPTEEYLKQVYDTTKANGKVVPPFPQVKAEIAQFVKGEQGQGLRQAFVARLRAEAKVEKLLPPLLLPKIEIAANGPSRGNPKAPVTIVEFSDYECPFCANSEPTLQRILASWPDQVKVVFQNYPLSIHQFARKASEAAFCAGEQGKYWEMHDRLFANQQALAEPALKQHARALGLDGAKFDRCLDSGSMASALEASRKLGESLGINATPTFYVNGRSVSGNLAFERFQELIDWELKNPGK